MPWTIQFNPATQTVELAYTGAVSPKDLQDALAAALDLATKNHTSLFLADCTDMVGGHSVGDLYFLISLFESSGFKNGIKEAILLPSLQSSVEDVYFYETACLNRGYNVKIFKHHDEAQAWLTG